MQNWFVSIQIDWGLLLKLAEMVHYEQAYPREKKTSKSNEKPAFSM